MIVYRLCRKDYANDLSGRGAEINGGRWNSKGVAAIYTASSRALCAIEIVVHVPAGIIPTDYFMVTISIPDSEVTDTISLKSLPANWNNNHIRLHPAYWQCVSCRTKGIGAQSAFRPLLKMSGITLLIRCNLSNAVSHMVLITASRDTFAESGFPCNAS